MSGKFCAKWSPNGPKGCQIAPKWRPKGTNNLEKHDFANIDFHTVFTV